MMHSTQCRPSRGLHGLLFDHVAVVDLQQGDYNKNWDESGKCTIFIKFSILRHTMQELVSKIRDYCQSVWKKRKRSIP